ncbi:helix-turn-helix domain-containing protein [Lactobacillus taiwanensis]|uniref:helix-turn-helix domain-containing protein n=1 Tax=Lactobacillus taiwanensis TaxID=508451 RepID=UPI00214BC527|nr:helix-turn-helix transcriptional regulator [Lactobacillus taiwanensis]MCR1902887.1 helix-turn-helix transcriptional regulator [Lactobacillus taiwanensis]
MNRLKELRQSKKLTLKELSQELKNININISPDSLSKYERGERNPKIDKWEKLADFFGVSVPYLQGYVDVKDKDKFFNDKDFFNKYVGKNWDKPNARGNITALLNEQDRRQFLSLYRMIMENDHSLDDLSKKVYTDEIAKIYLNLKIILEIYLKALTGDKKAKPFYEDIFKIVRKYDALQENNIFE